MLLCFIILMSCEFTEPTVEKSTISSKIYDDYYLIDLCEHTPFPSSTPKYQYRIHLINNNTINAAIFFSNKQFAIGDTLIFMKK